MTLSREQIDARLRDLPGWTFEDNAIVRKLTFASFPDAIAFVTRVAFDAEAADHHPDLHISYKRVTMSWSTHDAGGVTEKDFVGAREAHALAARLLPKG
jgi:4a-hydroxytetrahydrobiopterin dehydratase